MRMRESYTPYLVIDGETKEGRTLHRYVNLPADQTKTIEEQDYRVTFIPCRYKTKARARIAEIRTKNLIGGLTATLVTNRHLKRTTYRTRINETGTVKIFKTLAEAIDFFDNL